MNRFLAAVSLILVCGFQVASAHHSRAVFGGDVVELEGELLAVNWRRPHPSLRFRPTDGDLEELEVQVYGGVDDLEKAGVNRELFNELLNVGDSITLAGRFSRVRPDSFLGMHVMLPSGLEVVLQSDADPRWSENRVGGRGMEPAINESVLARAASANRGIFRVWSPESYESAIAAMRAMGSQREYTQAARAAFSEAGFGRDADTRREASVNANRRGGQRRGEQDECTWMPVAMYQPAARQFADHGDFYTLYSPYNGGILRTIWLDEVPADVDQAPSRSGTSVGHWEGNTLVIETAGMSHPSYDRRSLRSLDTSEMTVVERFTLSADQARLGYELVISDPVALVSPITFSYEYLALGEEIGSDVCVPPEE